MNFYELDQSELVLINGGALWDDIVRVAAATVGTVLIAVAPLVGFASGVATVAAAGTACLDYASK